MDYLKTPFVAICILGVFTALSAGTASADSSHARIIRLSLVQGDVRFARDVKGDPLADSRGDWEVAVLNLPIRQGYVVATDNGRAEVEFENGAMAFLAENSVLEFYDLSSEDGGFTTRLILRQGSAEFYVNPGRGDYFSVTGGDFSVQAESRATFRMNNFDDGSNVNVLHGKLTALASGKNTSLVSGQSFSIKAGDAEAATERNVPTDEFDQWVSGRIDNVSTATNAALQYSNSYDYTSGYADLYTYGAWFPVAGYGNCWRPYGVGLGWSPFDYGSWFYDAGFGWSFIGGQPWGWLPYHFGGWLFRPGVGWVWNPSNTFGGGVGRWRPVTGVWLRSATGMAIVPSHPLDTKGKPPLNLSAGMFAVTTRGVSGTLVPQSGEKWKIESKPARDVMQSQLAASSAPVRLSRTMAASGASSGHSATSDRNSAIIYDRTERRFVNSESSQVKNSSDGKMGAANATNAPAAPTSANKVPSTQSYRVDGRETATTAQVPAARAAAPTPSRLAPAPPSVPRSVVTERVFNGGGGSAVSSGGARSSSAGGASSAGRSSSAAPAAAPHASSGSTSSGGGGRPH
jgi:hypothetical protein